MPPIKPPPGFTVEHVEWALSQPRLYDDTEQLTETSAKPTTQLDEAESNKTEPSNNESDGGEPDKPALPPLGPPGTPCDFTWDRFKKPLSEWQEGLEAIYKPYSDETWSICTTEEWLYGVLRARLVTRFERQAIGPTEQEEKEIHVICMLAKYYLIRREEMGQAHIPIYVEEALSDAIIRLTWGEVDFTE